MSLIKMEDEIKNIFGEDYAIKLYNDACFIEFEHDNNTATFAIGLISYPGSIRIRDISLKKRFDEIESILQPVLDNHKIKLGFWQATIFRDIKFESGEFATNDRDAVASVFNDVKSICLASKQDFLDNYKSLHEVYNASEGMGIKEMVDFIAQPLPLRRMVVKKLCKDDNFIDFCKKYIVSAEQKAKKKPLQFKNYDKAAIELYQVLKSL